MVGNDFKQAKETPSAPLITIAAGVAPEGKDLWTLPSEIDRTHRFLFWLPYHSAISTSLSLLFPAFHSHSTFICFSFPMASAQSCLLLCHGWVSSSLSWVIPSVSAPGCSMLCILSPWKDLLRSCAIRLVQNGHIWLASPAWYPTEAAGSLPLTYWRRHLGQGWSLGPEPTVISAYEWVLWLSESMMHCLRMGKMFGRDSHVEGRGGSVVKW